MAEYKEFHCPYGDDFEGGDECDRCEQYELCMETPSIDVVERSKYDNLHNLAKSWLEEKKELERANAELRSKIENAINEIEERKKCLHTDIYNIDSIEFGKGLDLALKIFKKNIGE